MFAKDGNLYFYSLSYSSTVSIYKFSPETRELSVFTTVEKLSIGSGSMFMDNDSQLWLGVMSVINKEGKQEIIHPNYDLYKEKVLDWQGENYFSSTSILGESSNHILWFTQRNIFNSGTAWYNPKTNESCWFTTFSGNVIEDEQHKLWFLANKKLFTNGVEN